MINYSFPLLPLVTEQLEIDQIIKHWNDLCILPETARRSTSPLMEREMLNPTYNYKGISLVEVLISIFLISTGILSLLSLQPSAWNLSLKSDFLGRAGSILHSELEGNQILLMNPNYPNPCSASNPITLTKTVNPSSQSIAQAGDLTFTVQTGIQDNLNSTWTVRVSVSWPGNNAGISETRVITRQESFRF